MRLKFLIVPLATALFMLLPGCEFLDIRPEAIGVSNTELLIDRNEIIYTIFTWNTNKDIDVLALDITASENWVVLNTDFEISNAPQTNEGPFDKKSITVSIDRTQLSKGTHEATIKIGAIAVKPVEIKVRVIQDTETQFGGLNIDRPEVRFSTPYLVDITFGLRDEEGNIIVGEPAQYAVRAREGSGIIGEETGVHLKRTGSRQLRVMLVMDYSQSMQERTDAITDMENAATEILLPALNDSAQIGVVEFHRDDIGPTVVVNPTSDEDLVLERIARIQPDIVDGFYSGSKLWDAIVLAALRFNSSNIINEDRHIIVLTDGNDTSSVFTLDDVFDATGFRDIRVTVIAFGQDANAEILSALTNNTGGLFFRAEDTEDLSDAINELISELQDRLLLRWATVRRSGQSVKVGFDIFFNGNSDTFESSTRLDAEDLSGDVLEGRLRFVPPEDNSNTIYLRADYVPRFIETLRIYLHSDKNFEVSQVGYTEDGLISNWVMTLVPDPQSGGRWLELNSQSGPLPFATLGPLLRFDFTVPIVESELPFDEVYVDNDIYRNGQNFTVNSYDNSLPDDVIPFPDLTWTEQNLEYLLINTLQPGVTTLDSGLQYTVINDVPGDSPAPEDSLVIKLRGELIDGTVIEDSFVTNLPETVVLNTLIAGAQEGLGLMSIGDRWKFFIPPALAFGADGKEDVPGGSVFILEIELLDIIPAQNPLSP